VWSHKGPTLKRIRNWAPRYATFFSWPKVGYFLDRVVCVDLYWLIQWLTDEVVIRSVPCGS
jgi:hypothetical protein